MPDDEWQWDETLFAGAAPYYTRGRLPYAAGLADAIRDALGLAGSGRLIDVGCGPGTIALRLAHLFEEVVGIDPDTGMLLEAEREAARAGIANVVWGQMRAEELTDDLGTFRVATFSRSFHWMDRDRVAEITLRMLEARGRGAFVQVTDVQGDLTELGPRSMRHPSMPLDGMRALVRTYLGSVRRAGQGVRPITPDGETIVLERAGFEAPQILRVPGPRRLDRTADDIVALVFSGSDAAPHLFGKRLPEFEVELRELLARTSASGLFTEPVPDTEIRIWRTPAR
jgi:SAM-dependent methyltransferase